MPTSTPCQATPAPRSKVVGMSATSTIDNKRRAEVKIHVRKPLILFYIGGAGDKRKYLPLPGIVAGPFRNVLDARAHVNAKVKDLLAAKLLHDHWLGYYEIYGTDRISKNVLPLIPTKATPIIIIGHSLGGWNGAHLSRTLSNMGHNVELLVTIDPVGGGAVVTTSSDIYPKTPEVSAKMWINILAEPKDPNGSDAIAEFGERWIIKTGPTINSSLDVNHADAGIIFNRKIAGEKTTADLVVDVIRRCTK